MKRKLLLVFLALSATAAAYDAAISYFARSRALIISGSSPQSYIVVDSDIWKNARSDLSDIRLYDGQSQVPYALVKQGGGNSTQEEAAKVLNLGTVGGHTEFDLDVSALSEYGRVRLRLDAKNFINNANVQGRKSVNDRSGVDLGGSTLYDFTAEGLGSNSTLKFATSSFPYLHVRLAPGIRPDQVKGAYLSNFAETRATWSVAGQCSPVAAQPKQSAFECSIDDGVPLERIVFQMNGVGGPQNFSRTVIVSDQKGSEIESGSISRVLVKRAGQTVSNENLAIDMHPQMGRRIRIIVENGDDTPLPISQVQPLSFERRIYFDPRGHSSLILYYGDSKLEAPSYDYAKFFQQDPTAVAVQLAPAQANAQFSGRPDDRPWSERHNWVLWAAMVLAVLVLGVLTLRGLKSEAAEQK